jgi:hypothetical protein
MPQPKGDAVLSDKEISTSVSV